MDKILYYPNLYQSVQYEVCTASEFAICERFVVDPGLCTFRRGSTHLIISQVLSSLSMNTCLGGASNTKAEAVS